MERDAWNKQNRQKRFQGMGFPVKEPNEYACIVLKSWFCTSGWSLFLSVQLSVQNFPTESSIGPYGGLARVGLVCIPVCSVFRRIRSRRGGGGVGRGGEGFIALWGGTLPGFGESRIPSPPPTA